MAQQPAHSIIAELEDAVRDGTSAKRVNTLRRVTDLFLNDGDRLSDEQTAAFHRDGFVRLEGFADAAVGQEMLARVIDLARAAEKGRINKDQDVSPVKK